MPWNSTHMVLTSSKATTCEIHTWIETLIASPKGTTLTASYKQPSISTFQKQQFIVYFTT